MKKWIITILTLGAAVIALPASAQHYLGVKGGWGVGFGRFYPAKNMNLQYNLYSGGVMWKYYDSYKYATGVNKYAGGISAELEFLQRGFGYEVREAGSTDTLAYSRRINAAVLPLMWQPHLTSRNGTFRIYLNLGIMFSYNMSSREKLTRNRAVEYDREYPMLRIRDNRWGYGLCGGPGVNIVLDKFEIMLEARYYISYSDILRNRTIYPGPDPFGGRSPLSSPIDNVNVSFGLFYRFGDDARYGIMNREQRAAAKQARREGRRNAKNNQE